MLDFAADEGRQRTGAIRADYSQWKRVVVTRRCLRCCKGVVKTRLQRPTAEVRENVSRPARGYGIVAHSNGKAQQLLLASGGRDRVGAWCWPSRRSRLDTDEAGEGATQRELRALSGRSTGTETN